MGDVLDLIIMKTNDAEGTVMLSKKRFDAIKAWDDVVKASEDESILGVITDVIKACLPHQRRACVYPGFPSHCLPRRAAGWPAAPACAVPHH